MNVHQGRTIIFIVVAALLPASRANSRTWSVFPDLSGDAPTIQDGIDSSATGDTVLVHAGTYSEHIDLKGKLITVLGASGPGNTILDGSSISGAVVTFQSGEGRESRLEGFTIQSGLHGIEVSAAEPTIIGNIITGNGGASPSLSGAGIFCGGTSDRVWSPLIRENNIRENTATGNGGGIAIQEAMAPEVLYNTIFDNQAQQSGGGIYVFIQNSESVLQHNVIDTNVAGIQGGGIYTQGSNGGFRLSIDIGFSVLIKNSAHGAGMGTSTGGGIYLNNTNVVAHHLTVVKNTVPIGQLGSGVAFDGPGVPRLEKSIVAFNSEGGAIACTGAATPVIRYTLAWANAGTTGAGSCSNWYQSNGNLVADPLFCNLDEGDVTVSASSPALLPPGGPMGAYIEPGCSGTPVLPATWGALKARFHQ